jgi:hypothetical protein
MLSDSIVAVVDVAKMLRPIAAREPPLIRVNSLWIPALVTKRPNKIIYQSPLKAK